MLTPAFIHLRGVEKQYGGLRPLRIDDLEVAPGEIVVVEGPDDAAASVLVDLVTGTTLPERGEVTAAGTVTSTLADPHAWLAFVEQFGIVSSRVVLLDDFSVLQNLAVPLTLDLEPLPEAVRGPLRELAHRVGLAPESLDIPLGRATELTRFRVRLGRAIAHRPGALLVMHPTVGLQASDVTQCGETLKTAVGDWGPAVLVVTNDTRLASLVATRRLAWAPATGRLSERRGWRERFGKH